MLWFSIVEVSEIFEVIVLKLLLGSSVFSFIFSLPIRLDDRVTEPATLPKMAVHAGNTFTIFSDSFQKVTAATNNNPVVTGSGSQTSSSNSKLAAGTCVQFTSGKCGQIVSFNE